jgi:glycosyltransferase involved in cell wall biosynthesis
MKKKILIDATTVIDKVDGLSTYIINLLRNLPVESFDIFDYMILVHTGPVRPELATLLLDSRFTVIKKRIAPIGPKREWDMLWFLKKYRKSFDLFHSTSNYYPMFLKGGIATVHDITFRKYFNAPWWSFNMAPRFLSFITRNALYRAKAVIAVSNFTKKDLSESFKLSNKIKNKIEIIYEGWEHLQPEPGEAVINETPIQFENYLLYVGTTRLHKNMKNLLKALSIAKDSLPKQISIVVCGNASYLDLDDKKNIDLINGGGERVFFTGFVSKNVLEQLFRNADAFIFPSLSEGFGIPVLESFYFEKPLLCSNTTSLPEIAGDAALYFNPEDPANIAEAIVNFYKDASIGPALISKGNDRLKLFSWKKTAAETIALYKKILGL